MSSEFNQNNYSSKMEKSISSFKKDISTLRTGRANTSMLDIIKVDCSVADKVSATLSIMEIDV